MADFEVPLARWACVGRDHGEVVIDPCDEDDTATVTAGHAGARAGARGRGDDLMAWPYTIEEYAVPWDEADSGEYQRVTENAVRAFAEIARLQRHVDAAFECASSGDAHGARLELTQARWGSATNPSD